MFRQFNFTASNAASSPALSMSAAALELWRPSDGNILGVYTAQSNVACSIASTGAGGRDTAAVFPPKSAIHFYWIGGTGQPVATFCSLSPPLAGPAMPSGYDHFCYATTIMLDQYGAGSLMSVDCVDDEVFFDTVSPFPVFLLNPTISKYNAVSITKPVTAPSGYPLTAIDSVYPQFGVRISAVSFALLRPGDNDIHTIATPQTNVLVTFNGGPAAYYRDTAAEFAAGIDLHLYWIWGSGPGLAAIISASPPNIGPALPSGYDHWQYHDSASTNSTPLSSPPLNGQLISPLSTPVAGHNTTLTAICVAPAIPAIALSFDIFVDPQIVVGTVSESASSALIFQLHDIPPPNSAAYAIASCFAVRGSAAALLGAIADDYVESFPNIDPKQNIYYYWDDIESAYISERYASLFMRKYKVPS